MSRHDSLWVCIRVVSEPNGVYHTHTITQYGATREDAVNFVLKTTHLQEGWKVVKISACPFEYVTTWQVEESPAWKLGELI